MKSFFLSFIVTLMASILTACNSIDIHKPKRVPLADKELMPLLIAEGIPSVWRKQQFMYELNEPVWGMEIYEDPIPVSDQACFFKHHSLSIHRDQDKFVVKRTFDDNLRVALTSCRAISDPDQVSPVYFESNGYLNLSSKEMEDTVNLLYAVLAWNKQPNLVIDQILPELEKPFLKIKARNLVFFNYFSPDKLKADFSSKALSGYQLNIGILIERRADGLIHIEVGLAPYDVLE